MYGITNVIPVAGAAIGTAVIDPSDPTSAVLAFTGFALGAYLIVGCSLLIAGVGLRILGRRSSGSRNS